MNVEVTAQESGNHLNEGEKGTKRILSSYKWLL